MAGLLAVQHFKRTLQIINAERRVPVLGLKPKQIDCMKLSTDQQGNRRDVLAILPTGYGKSLLFELVPTYTALLAGKENSRITFILSPLNAIISQQLQVLGPQAKLLRSANIAKQIIEPSDDNDDCWSDADSEDDCLIPEEPITLHELKAGNFRYLIGHPEDFLDPSVMGIFRKAAWKGNVGYLVVDEAHCCVLWGNDFRLKYMQISELRSVYSEVDTKVLAVTATATVSMQKDIVRLLCMTEPGILVGQSDRPNIKYKVIRRPAHAGHGRTVEASYTSVFLPLLEDLKERRQSFPKTVVYTMLKWCGFGNELGVKVLTDGIVTSAGVKEIAQFHAPLLPEVTQLFKLDSLIIRICKLQKFKSENTEQGFRGYRIT